MATTLGSTIAAAQTGPKPRAAFAFAPAKIDGMCQPASARTWTVWADHARLWAGKPLASWQSSDTRHVEVAPSASPVKRCVFTFTASLAQPLGVSDAPVRLRVHYNVDTAVRHAEAGVSVKGCRTAHLQSACQGERWRGTVVGPDYVEVFIDREEIEAAGYIEAKIGLLTRTQPRATAALHIDWVELWI